MAATNLSPGMIKSMTRGAPARGSPGGDGPGARMSLLDRLSLLRLIAEDPPPELDAALEEIRRNRGDDVHSVFDRLKSLVQDQSAQF